MSYLTTPRLTTAERDALTNVQDGAQIYNTDINTLQITNDAGTTWVDVEAAPSGSNFLLDTNNLSDVANKESSQRNLGLATDFEFIGDNIDRVYTTANQPAVVSAVYTESGHSVQICPMNEIASPTAGTFFCGIASVGPADLDIKDATGAVVFTVPSGKSFWVKNQDTTLGGNLQFLEEHFSAISPGHVNSVNLQTSYENSRFDYPAYDTAGLVMTAQEFNIFDNDFGNTYNSIDSAPTNSGSALNPGVEATVYQPTEDIYITSLKVWDAHFTQAPDSRVVVIYDRFSEVELAQATVLKTDSLVNGYRVSQLDRPLFVLSGQTIVVAQRYYNGDFYATSVTPTSDIDILEAAQSFNTPGIEFPSTFEGIPDVAHAGFFDYQLVSRAFSVFDGGGGSGVLIPSISPDSLVTTNPLSQLEAGDLSGDISTSGGLTTTLATVNSNIGSFGDANNVPQVTLDAKGRVTAASNIPIAGTSETLQEVYDNSNPDYDIDISGNDLKFNSTSGTNGHVFNASNAGSTIFEMFSEAAASLDIIQAKNNVVSVPAALGEVCSVANGKVHSTIHTEADNVTIGLEESSVYFEGLNAGVPSEYLRYTGATDDVQLIDSKIITTTASTSTTTGSLINSGGIGNAGDLWNGGDVHIEGNRIKYEETIVSETVFSANTKKIVANEAIAVGEILKPSTTAFRVEKLKAADGDDIGIIGIAATASAAAGDTIEVYNLEVFPVVLNGTVAAGDPLEKSGVVDGRVVTSPASPGTFAEALQAGVVGETILAAHIMNEVF